MAIDYPILFTGKEISFEPRSTGELERSAQRFQDIVLGAKKYEYEEKQRRSDQFYKDLAIDPIDLVSKESIRQQAEALNGYNAKWAKKFNEYNGLLPNELRMEMAMDKKALQNYQVGWKASQAMWAKDMEMISRKPELYDLDVMRDATEKFMNSSKYKSGDGIDYKAIDPRLYFQQHPLKKGKFGYTSATIVGNETIYNEDTVSANDEDTMNYISGNIMQIGGLLKGAIQDFQNQPEDVKKKYLQDIDQSGYIEDYEVKDPVNANGILRWAREAYKEDAREHILRGREANRSAGLNFIFEGGAWKKGDRVYFRATTNPIKDVMVSSDKGGLLFTPSEMEWVEIPAEDVTLSEGVNIEDRTLWVKASKAADGIMQVNIDPKRMGGFVKTVSAKNFSKIPQDIRLKTKAYQEIKDDNGKVIGYKYKVQAKPEDNVIGAVSIKDNLDTVETIGLEMGGIEFVNKLKELYPDWFKEEETVVTEESVVEEDFSQYKRK